MNQEYGYFSVLCATSLIFPAAPPCQGEPTRNQVRNGSFEVGMTHGDWGVVGGHGYLLSQDSLDTKTSAHGKTSLRVNAGASLFTAPFTPGEVGDYKVSLAMKSERAQTVGISIVTEETVPLEITNPRMVFGRHSFKVGTKWETFETTIPLPQTRTHLRIMPTTEGGDFWIDAVSILPGKSPAQLINQVTELDPGEDEEDEDLPFEPRKPRKFIPRSNVEAGLYSEIPGRVFYDDEAVEWIGRLYNHGDTGKRASLEYEIEDIHRNVIRRGRKEDLEALPGKASAFQLALKDHPKGLFSLRYWLKESPHDVGEVVYSVIRRPAKETILGACSHSTHTIMRILQRAGVRHYYPLTDGWLRPSALCPGGPNYNWFDDKAAIAEKYGLKTYGILASHLYGREGSWTANWKEKETIRVEPPIIVRKGHLTDYTYVEKNAWRKHAKTVAGHYQPWIKGWILDDEVNNIPPELYLRIARGAKEGIKEAAPDVKMAVSASSLWFEELIGLGGLDTFDAIAGTIGGESYWEARKTGWLARKFGKEVWESAILKYGHSFYHTHGQLGQFNEWKHRALSAYRSLTRCFFLQRSKFVSPYCFRLTTFSTMNTMSKSMLDYDGGLKTNGFGFVMAGTLFSHWKPTEEQPDLPHIREVYTFHENGRPGALMRIGARTVLFPMASEKVRVFDWCGNPTKIGKPVKDGLALAVKAPFHPPFYLLASDGVAENDFWEAVRNIRVLPPGKPVHRELFWVKDGEVVRANVSIDHQQGSATIKSTTPSRFIPSRPLENRNGAWLLNSPRLSRGPTIDGRLDEWAWRSPGTMNMRWEWLDPSTRGEMHVHRGSEFLNYKPWYDFKVRFYSGYDGENLYFAAHVNDDDIAPPEMARQGVRDGLEFRLDLDLLGDLGTDSRSSDDFVIRAELESPTQSKAQIENRGKTEALVSAVVRHERGYNLEIAVPFSRLTGLAPRPLSIIGLDVIATDADYDRKYKGEEKLKREHSQYRWAAGAPVGQLIFTAELESGRD